MTADKIREFVKFQDLLHCYLDRAINNIEGCSRFDNTNEADKVMEEVF